MINRAQYIKERADAAAIAATLDAAYKQIAWLERQEDQLRLEIRDERQRAQFAIDELLKRHDVTPISPDAAERKLVTDAMETIWDEDPVAVTKMQERMATEGYATIYAEALEDQLSNE